MIQDQTCRHGFHECKECGAGEKWKDEPPPVWPSNWYPLTPEQCEIKRQYDEWKAKRLTVTQDHQGAPADDGGEP